MVGSDSDGDSRETEELGAGERPQEAVQEHDQRPGEVVACDAPQEDGKPLYRCPSLTRGSEDQARRCVDQVHVVFPSEAGFWCTQEMSALNAGRCSTVEPDQLRA